MTIAKLVGSIHRMPPWAKIIDEDKHTLGVLHVDFINQEINLVSTPYETYEDFNICIDTLIFFGKNSHFRNGLVRVNNSFVKDFKIDKHLRALMLIGA